MCHWRLVTVTVCLTAVLAAQEPRLAFEVASIKKRDGPVQGFARLLAEHGTFSVPATTAAYLVQFAYQVRDDLIVDGPPWIRTDNFEVNAKAGKDVTADEMRPMMQSLLAERFGLVVRREPREMRHFALVAARPDRGLGPNIRQTDTCQNRETRPTQPALPRSAAVTAGCSTMPRIAETVSRWVGAPVIDRTGIAGTFHYFMHYSAEDAPVLNLPGFPSGAVRPQVNPDADPGLPSFRDALRDQLGLRTELERGPIDALAIESIHQPTEN